MMPLLILLAITMFFFANAPAHLSEAHIFLKNALIVYHEQVSTSLLYAQPEPTKEMIIVPNGHIHPQKHR